MSTVSRLEQGYVVCPSQQRFLLLFTFLKRNLKKKVMVFFSSCNAVKYQAELLNYIDIPCLDIMKAKNSAERLPFRVCNAKTGILLCTDVAARGLDILLWTGSSSTTPQTTLRNTFTALEGLHGATGRGRALLFLLPSELGFLNICVLPKLRSTSTNFQRTKLLMCSHSWNASWRKLLFA